MSHSDTERSPTSVPVRLSDPDPTAGTRHFVDKRRGGKGRGKGRGEEGWKGEETEGLRTRSDKRDSRGRNTEVDKMNKRTQTETYQNLLVSNTPTEILHRFCSSTV